MKNSLDTLCELFGNHYGSSFYLMQTRINNPTQINDMIDEGLLSPEEIHDFLHGIN